MTIPDLAAYQAQYYASLSSSRAASDTAESIAYPLGDSRTYLNPHQVLSSELGVRKQRLLREINQRNLGSEQELEKLDVWADDLKLGIEQEIKAIDVEIKQIRGTAATSPMLEEKLAHQKCQRELESKRSQLRRELFARQGEVEAQRSNLIAQLELQLQQQVQQEILFTIEWELV